MSYAINTGRQPAATAMKIPIPRKATRRIKNLREMAQPAERLSDRGHVLDRNHVDGVRPTIAITRLSAAQAVAVTVVGVQAVTAQAVIVQAVGVEVVGVQADPVTAAARHRGHQGTGTDEVGQRYAEIDPGSVVIPTGNVVVIAVHLAIAGVAAIPKIIDRHETTD